MVEFDVILSYGSFESDAHVPGQDEDSKSIRRTLKLSSRLNLGDELRIGDDIVLVVESVALCLLTQKIEILFETTGEIAVRAFLLSPDKWDTSKGMSIYDESYFFKKVKEAQEVEAQN